MLIVFRAKKIEARATERVAKKALPVDQQHRRRQDLKIKVAVLGATGTVGREYLAFLKDHPWFQVVEVSGSSKIGRKLGDVFPDLPDGMGSLEIKESDPSKMKADLVFSPLPTNAAKEVERDFAESGFKVITDASPNRMEPDVPLIIPEVNPGHLKILKDMRSGFIVATPNCTTVGLAMTLKPIHDAFGVNRVVMTSFQALSGAGYPGVASLDIQDNVLPFIEGEEEKVAIETNKILGTLDRSQTKVSSATIEIFSSCNRVAVSDGHLESVYLETEKEMVDPDTEFESFVGLPQRLKLPSAPPHPIILRREENRPQPKLDRLAGKGMSTVVGRIRRGKDGKTLQYHLLTHNTIRGAAGGAVLTGELIAKQIGLH
jgi:aspartate-semialdehyde dehydrogenase